MGFGDSLQQQLLDFFTNYETRPRVVLRSAWLRVPQLFIIWGLVIYIFAKQLLLNLKVMKHIHVKPIPLLAILPRLQQRGCEERQLDCIDYNYDVKDTTLFPYCMPRKELNISGCIPFSGVSTTTGSSTFVMTMYTEFTQRFSRSEGWRATKVSRNYTVGSEGLAVQVSHTFERHFTEFNAQGFVEFANGTLCKLKCRRKQNCPQDHSALGKRASDCPGDEAETWDWADSLLFGLLLSAANLSLDTETQHWIHKAPLRYWGTTFGLEVEYTNARSDEFWTWPFGPKLMYIYRPRQLSLQKATQTYDIDVPPSSPSDGATRVIPKRSGVFILPEGRGNILTFCWSYAFTAIVVSVSGLSIASMIVETILVRFYSMFRSLRHVAILYHLYSSHTSPPETEVKDVVVNEDVAPSEKVELLKRLHSRIEMDREQAQFIL